MGAGFNSGSPQGRLLQLAAIRKVFNMTMLLITVITAYLLGMYFLYRHWRNTPPDAFLKRGTAKPAERTQGNTAHKARWIRGSTMKNMNRHNQEEKTRYGKPFNLSFRRRPRRFKGVNYSLHSPELAAMTAHIRASAYPDRKQSPAADGNYLVGGGESPAIRPLSFSNLLRDYDSQARSNFTKEAVLFAIIVVTGMLWPIVQTFRDLPR